MRDAEIYILGCGGLLYHGMPRLATILNSDAGRDSMVTLIDGDLVEEHNRARQWGSGVREPKCFLALKMLRALGVTQTMHTLVERVQNAGDVSDLMPRHMKGRRVVIVLPDNQLARVNVHNGIAETPWPTWEIVAGNAVSGGQCSLDHWTGRRWGYNWLEAHPDVLEEARAEHDAAQGRFSCTGTPQAVVQSARANQQTSVLWLDALRTVLVGQPKVGDVYWAYVEKKRTGKIYSL